MSKIAALSGRISGTLALLVLCVTPPAAQAASFNCNIADRPDEVLICQDGRLSALDERMSSLYFNLRNSLVGRERSRLEADQAAWLRARYSCGRDYGCIRGLYESRISELAHY
jgi:uncharacterized protein